MELSEFFAMQKRLAEAKGWTDQRNPDHAPMSILWSIDELGEAIAIIKKKGSSAIMDNPAVRGHFVEECADVFMYLFDMMISYGITPEEFTDAYVEKFRRNMGRDWHENDVMYDKVPWSVVVFDLTNGSIPEREVEIFSKTGLPFAAVGVTHEDCPIEAAYAVGGDDFASLLGNVRGQFHAKPEEILVCSTSEDNKVTAKSLGYAVNE